MACLFIVGTHLVDNIEVQSGKSLNAGLVNGIAADYPVESGLILTVLLLLGCAPGSLLFVIEDIAIGQIFDVSLVTAIAMAVIVVVSSIACYRSFTRIFHGRGVALNPKNLNKEHFFAERLILAITIILGVLPKFIG